MEVINLLNDFLWSYLLIAALLGCAGWFTLKTRFVQFRMIGEMVRLLGDSALKGTGHQKHISSFQAFAISLASRVGTGNLAGVGTAIAVGGPGAVFWMWIIALFGSSSAFVESTLAQLYKVRGKDSFIGGPAYYMRRGLKKPWMGSLFAILIIVTFGLAFNSVQSNTLCAAFESAFGFDHRLMGSCITLATLSVIFGGVHRIARVSSIIVPFMALGYIAIALIVVLMNITHLPDVLCSILENAFGWERAGGGGVRAALMHEHERGRSSSATRPVWVRHPTLQLLPIPRILSSKASSRHWESLPTRCSSAHVRPASFCSAVLRQMVRSTEYSLRKKPSTAR